MKVKQINEMKIKVFEEKELKEKFNLIDDEIKLILNYQVKFPELLQKRDGFCIDGRNLHNKIVKNIKENKTGTEFAKWIKRKIKKYNFHENQDYEVFVKKDDNLKGGRPTEEYTLTLEMAKMLAMIENNKIGHEVRRYFILAEKTFRNYEKWNEVRGIEKEGYKEMNKYIEDWCKKRNYDYNDRIFYIREANLINQSLLNMKAYEINYALKNNDRATRNHLSVSINKAIQELQKLNESLLLANMDFDTRKQIIEATCNSKYSDLRDEFLKII
ncbi:antA/AntB antirepressor family protein [Clostridium botulinum]|uniref:antA/AntB antirepressor family protein n=1 Tax=Clostridium botulinum TaxID=1491 RepID=UPI000774685C|nr:antA/AntB antirepressor family protein [Clostridium botulinum]